MANEIEVFRIQPQEQRCYQHIEATRSDYIGGGNRRYFSSNEPRYVGRFIRHERDGYGDGGHSWDIFKDGAQENRVDYSYEGNTCFIEVPCKNIDKPGKRRPDKHDPRIVLSFGGKRKTRRLHKKPKKTRGRR